MNFFMKPGGEASRLQTVAPVARRDAISNENFAGRAHRVLLAIVRSWWRHWRSRPARQLRLCETLALGERRFLVVVEFESQKFLIGTSGNAMTLLTKLGHTELGDTGLEPEEFAAEESGREISGIRLTRGKDVTE